MSLVIPPVNEFVVTCPDCGEEVTTHVEEDVRGSGGASTRQRSRTGIR